MPMTERSGRNMTLCQTCWEHELEYRRSMNKTLASIFERFDLPAWETATNEREKPE